MCTPTCKKRKKKSTNNKPTVQMASSFAMMFDEILRREMTSMLSRVAEGEGLNLDYLVSTYFPSDLPPTPAKEVKEPPKKRAAKVVTTEEPKTKTTKCTAVTAKGKPCSLNAVSGGCMCRVHLKSEGKEKKPAPVKKPTPAPAEKKKPAKKKKTEEPKHTHELDTKEHDDCELCQSHGTPLVDTDDEEEFELVKSPPRTLKERLAKIVKTQEYEDEDEEDEPVVAEVIEEPYLDDSEDDD